MALALVFKKTKSFLLFIVHVFKRALCCFRRRRRSCDFTPLVQVGVVPNSNSTGVIESDSWNDWNEEISIQSCKPNSVQEHIEFYRKQAIAARQVQEDAPEVQENFFQDMTPVITKQTKLYVNDKNDDNYVNRLSLNPEAVAVMGQELGDWEENRGWEGQTLDWDAKQALKESRRQVRQKKMWEQQQQRKQEKFTRSALGAKVYS